jgi:hypothetical protein
VGSRAGLGVVESGEKYFFLTWILTPDPPISSLVSMPIEKD